MKKKRFSFIYREYAGSSQEICNRNNLEMFFFVRKYNLVIGLIRIFSCENLCIKKSLLKQEKSVVK